MTSPTTKLLISLLLGACCDPSPPTCAELGCPGAPSGRDDTWVPCPATADVCYCRLDNETVAECRQKDDNVTQNDKRILILALHADTDVEAVPSMEPHPEGRQSVAQSPNYPWDWCDVEVSAQYAGVEARVLLKAQTWPDQAGFYRSDVYRDAQVRALTELLGKLDAAADVISVVGKSPAPAGKPTPRAKTNPGRVRA